MLKRALITFVVLVALGIAGGLLAARVPAGVKVSRVLNAPIEKVWLYYIDGDTMKRWWGPKDYTAPIIKNDFRVGGTFFYSMKSPSGEIHYNTGTFTDIALHKRIRAKMSFANENGLAIPASQLGIPGHWPNEVELLIEFTDLEGQKTRLEVTEKGVPLIMKIFARLGWEQQLDKFEKVLQ